jgi:ABC-type transport system involved in cytochrome bd biosynthesis fused ATPase/permease subunit
MDDTKTLLDTIRDKISEVFKDTMSDVTSEIKNKIEEADKTIINRGIEIVQKRLNGYMIIGALLYIVPLILLIYIIYLH